MRVADWIIQRLEQAGIGHVFTVCGGGSIFLNDALGKAKTMRYVACHHEQAAAMAAEAYARVRTGIGCAMVTSGPGGTNAITGIAGAWLDHVPLLVISGQVFRSQMIDSRLDLRADHPPLRTLGVQEINIVDMVAPITKYAVVVTDPQSIRFHVERALYLATEGRPGPVLLDIPADVQNAQIEPDKLEGFRAPDEFGHALNYYQRVESVDMLLRMARRPLVHIGQGVRLAGAMLPFFRFIEEAQIPVVTARNGNDLIASDHPLYIGRPGTFAQRGANFAVQTCDVYLAIGTRLCLAQTGYNAKDYARNAKIVMVDVDAAELGKDTVVLHEAVRMDAGDFLCDLNARSGAMAWPPYPDWSGWLQRCKDWQAKYPAVTQAQREQGTYVNSYHLIEELSAQCLPDDVIVTDVGFAYQCTSQAWRIKQGQRLLTNGGLAPMGWGLPAAIGAAIGSGRRVILIVGDGGLMMNLQELATLAHHKLNVKIFLLNNGGYLTMRQSQAHAFDGYMGSDESSGLSFPDFEGIAHSFNLIWRTVYRAKNVEAVIRECLSFDYPAFCEVMMDPDQALEPKSINRREPDGTIKQTAIEDAWPFLPAEEIEQEMRT